MTLNVNLEDVPWEILEAVRLRILAERRAMEQSRLQRRPIALRPQAQFAKLGARADQRRLPEPAAILDAPSTIIAHAFTSDDLSYQSIQFRQIAPTLFFGGRSFTGLRSEASIPASISVRVSSVDKSSYVEDSVGLPTPSLGFGEVTTTGVIRIGPNSNGQVGEEITVYLSEAYGFTSNNDIRFYMLPVGRDLSILIAHVTYYLIVSKASNLSLFDRQRYNINDPNAIPWGEGNVNFLVNAVDSATSTTQLAANTPEPPVVVSQQDVSQFFGYLCGRSTVKKINVPAKVIDAIISGYDTGLSDLSEGFYSNSRYTSASIYKAFNEAANFVSPSSVKDFPPRKKPVVSDVRKGYYSGSESDQSLYYAYWTGDRSEIDLDQTEKFAGIRSATVLVPPGSSLLPDDFSTLHAAWDWDDSAYCRSMCLALGFSEADLKP
jgi:hypothetical protein